MAVQEASFRLPQVKTVRSLKDQAHVTIKEAILSMQLKPGQPLVEEELAHQLGISKTPVREALNELEREGLVVRVLFKGTHVADVCRKDVEEVCQLRAALEGLAARLATPLLSEEDLAKARTLITKAEKTLQEGNVELCSQLGRQLHQIIIKKADNHRLESFANNLDDHMVLVRVRSDSLAGRLPKSIEEHKRLLTALEGRDPLGAEKAMKDHIHSVLQDLLNEESLNAAPVLDRATNTLTGKPPSPH